VTGPVSLRLRHGTLHNIISTLEPAGTIDPLGPKGYLQVSTLAVNSPTPQGIGKSIDLFERGRAQRSCSREARQLLKLPQRLLLQREFESRQILRERVRPRTDEVDQHSQVIDEYVSERRDILAARRFFTAALSAHGEPDEVVTDRAQALDHVNEELLPAAFHNTWQYANNRVECDHGRLKASGARCAD